jgi:hypothetical protein
MAARPKRPVTRHSHRGAMITTEADFTASKEAAAPSPPRTGRGCRVAEPVTELPAWLAEVPDHAVLLIYRAFLDCLNPR